MANGARKRNEARQTRREVWGVALIALGIFLGVCLYFEAAGLIGAAITSVLFGLCGLFAYSLPPALLIGGIVFIGRARKGKRLFCDKLERIHTKVIVDVFIVDRKLAGAFFDDDSGDRFFSASGCHYLICQNISSLSLQCIDFRLLRFIVVRIACIDF